jgi:hypothetical protein
MIITVKTQVEIGGIAEGNPPMLTYHKIATRPDGKRKLIVQSAQVTELDLLVRLRREACNGMMAEVTVEQHLSPDGVSNILLDFALTEASLLLHPDIVSSSM